MDQQFIELFDKSKVAVHQEYLPNWPEIENDLFLTIEDDGNEEQEEGGGQIVPEYN